MVEECENHQLLMIKDCKDHRSLLLVLTFVTMRQSSSSIGHRFHHHPADIFNEMSLFEYVAIYSMLVYVIGDLTSNSIFRMISYWI